MKKYLIGFAILIASSCISEPRPVINHPSPNTPLQMYTARSGIWLQIKNSLPRHVDANHTTTDVVINHVKLCAQKPAGLEIGRGAKNLKNCVKFSNTIGYDEREVFEVKQDDMARIEAKRTSGELGDYELFIGTNDQQLKDVVWPCSNGAGNIRMKDPFTKEIFKWTVTQANQATFTCERD